MTEVNGDVLEKTSSSVSSVNSVSVIVFACRH